MGWFTSAYKALAHGAPNWDSQLRTDMQTLETFLDQGGWAPTYGGDNGATVGNAGGTNGSYTRIGQKFLYDGRVAFGSSAVAGGGVIAGANLGGTYSTTLSFGEGWYRNASTGVRSDLRLVPVTASEYKILVVKDGSLADFNTLGNPPQSSELFFKLNCYLT